MARAPDKRIEQAKTMYLKGMKLVEIASQLNLPEGTVRRWKSTHGWDNERSDKNNERSERKKERKKKAAENEVEQVMKNPDLTDKQRLFCLYYVRYFNATKAYQKAYECSYDVANAEGYKLLVNPCIVDEIHRLKKSRLNRELLDEHDIFQKYMDIAFADITDFVQFGQEEEYVIGSFGPIQVEDPITGKKVPLKQKVNTVHFRESDNVDGTIIAEIKNGKNGASIKLADRMKALEWLARHMDMATEEQKTKIEQIKAQTAAIKAKAQANDNSFMEKEQSKLDDLIRQMRGGDG
ncbi:MAG: terminase small subunit [Fusicatenibacter saccharivorans]|nr:terminase small subunit [Fusicatenibacter saccharivorans]